MTNTHFKELELSHSDSIRKDVVSFLSSAVMVFYCSNEDGDGEDHKPKAKQQIQHPCLPVHYHMMCKAMTFCSFNSKM